ncbi:hypothetical protein TNCV_3349591 [Trichonephila clavipes]|nr:hypothetical protein TNCV_3349591 [Trichonephila clavipes]
MQPSGCYKEREMGGPWPSPNMFSLKIEDELSKIILSPAGCSKLQLTTGIQVFPGHDEFRGPRSDSIDQVALVTITRFITILRTPL